MAGDRFGVDVGTGLAHDEQQRALVPLGVVNPDRRRLCDTRAANRRILEFDRADPFAARFDDVLGAIGDLHRAVGMENGDVAGVEPAVGVGGILFGLEVALDDPQPTDLKPTAGLPVAR